MSTGYYPRLNDCTIFEVYSQEICFTVENCRPTCDTFLLAYPENIYDCNRCQVDPEYYHPYVPGDVLHIQSQFVDRYNTDHTVPVDGFGTFVTVELYDLAVSSDVPISSDYTTFSTAAMAAYNGEISYQILELDTNALPECWAIRIIPHLADGTPIPEETMESQRFKRVKCEETVLVESEWTDYDCCGNYYGEPTEYAGDLISYSNQVRFCANLVHTGNAITKEVFDDTEVNSVAVEKITTLALNKPIAPFASNIMMEQILGGKKIYVNGVEFFGESFTLNNRMRCGKAFLYEVELKQICERDFNC